MRRQDTVERLTHIPCDHFPKTSPTPRILRQVIAYSEDAKSPKTVIGLEEKMLCQTSVGKTPTFKSEKHSVAAKQHENNFGFAGTK
jgi:hypothetical protein